MATWCRGSFFGLGVLALGACSSEPQLNENPGGLVDMPGTGGTGGAGGSGGSGGDGATGGRVGSGGTIGVGGSSPAGSAGTSMTDPCAAKDCNEGQRCENQAGVATCVDRTCEELMCTATELCVSVDGGGHGCAPKCTSDAACDMALHCDTASGECVPDDCTPDTRMCGADDTVRVCSSNGAPGDPIKCGSAGYFASACTADQAGSGACTCEDDWDCPPYMTCDAGICTGTGFAPTCTLPATPFKDVLPAVEFRWGEGTKHNYSDDTTDNAVDDAVGKAFSWSSQVVSPPLVINLDDDNGDGRADERDFPEIIFITHDTDNRETHGVVRAVHGGGPNKGKDFFALCGNPAKPAEPAASYTDATNGGAYWSEGADLIDDCGDAGDITSGLARPSSTPAAGDLDGDGFPEIVVALETKGFQILSHRGEVLFQSPANVFEPMAATYVAPAPALVNLDFEGMPEIVIGARVVKLKMEGTAFAIDKIYEAKGASIGAQQSSPTGGGGGTYGPTVCVADLTAAPGMEIVAGPTAFKLPATTPANCGDVATPCPLDIVWDARSKITQTDGLCAIADVLGACTSVSDCMAKPTGPANPLDGKPEVVLIANGTLVILDGATGNLLRSEKLGDDYGGAPNVDDFDGDGFPEIATALASYYQVFDLQAPDDTNCPAWPTVLAETAAPPGTNPARNAGGACKTDADCTLTGTTCNEVSGQCVCLHNGWKRTSEDDSSRVTSSSVFDFNGDGAAEVAYGDECYFRLYDGATGAVFLALPSVSRTVLENPVIADVDNDGNAEIVFVSNNSFAQCDEGNVGMGMMNWHGANLSDWPTGTVAKDSLPAGLTVLGDPTDSWVAARRIWNEHSYHVTNVLESGAIPLHEPESFKPLNGRVYNTYRSQPRTYGVAPDLQVVAIQISSPDATCGELSEKIEITVAIKNGGDLRVGPGVEVAFYGDWGGTEAPLEAGGAPVVVTLDKSLEPGASTLVTITYSVGDNAAPNDGALPDSVRVTIDGGNASPDGKERECREDNNELVQKVDPGEALADLVVTIDSANCMGDVKVTVTNNGSHDAANVVVRIYAGDPATGGAVLGQSTIDSLPAGESTMLTVSIGEQARTVTLWAVVDPNDEVKECNDANNVVKGPVIICAPR